MNITISLSERAVQVINEVPYGERSAFICKLIEQSDYNPERELVRELNTLKRKFEAQNLELQADVKEMK